MSLWETERFWCVGARHDFCSTLVQKQESVCVMLLSVMLCAGLPSACILSTCLYWAASHLDLQISQWEGTVTLMTLIWAESQSSVHIWTADMSSTRERLQVMIITSVCWFVSRATQTRLNRTPQNLDGGRISAQNRPQNLLVWIQIKEGSSSLSLTLCVLSFSLNPRGIMQKKEKKDSGAFKLLLSSWGGLTSEVMQD